MMAKFIKVSQKGNKKITVVPATNEAFYKKQGYTISEPTKEEIDMYCPTPGTIPEKAADVNVADTAEYNSLLAEQLTTVKTEKADTDKKLADAVKKLADTDKKLADAMKELEGFKSAKK